MSDEVKTDSVPEVKLEQRSETEVVRLAIALERQPSETECGYIKRSEADVAKLAMFTSPELIQAMQNEQHHVSNLIPTETPLVELKSPELLAAAKNVDK